MIANNTTNSPCVPLLSQWIANRSRTTFNCDEDDSSMAEDGSSNYHTGDEAKNEKEVVNKEIMVPPRITEKETRNAADEITDTGCSVTSDDYESIIFNEFPETKAASNPQTHQSHEYANHMDRQQQMTEALEKFNETVDILITQIRKGLLTRSRSTTPNCHCRKSETPNVMNNWRIHLAHTSQTSDSIIDRSKNSHANAVIHLQGHKDKSKHHHRFNPRQRENIYVRSSTFRQRNSDELHIPLMSSAEYSSTIDRKISNVLQEEESSTASDDELHQQKNTSNASTGKGSSQECCAGSRGSYRRIAGSEDFRQDVSDSETVNELQTVHLNQQQLAIVAASFVDNLSLERVEEIIVQIESGMLARNRSHTTLQTSGNHSFLEWTKYIAIEQLMTSNRKKYLENLIRSLGSDWEQFIEQTVMDDFIEQLIALKQRNEIINVQPSNSPSDEDAPGLEVEDNSRESANVQIKNQNISRRNRTDSVGEKNRTHLDGNEHQILLLQPETIIQESQAIEMNLNSSCNSQRLLFFNAKVIWCALVLLFSLNLVLIISFGVVLFVPTLTSTPIPSSSPTTVLSNKDDGSGNGDPELGSEEGEGEGDDQKEDHDYEQKPSMTTKSTINRKQKNNFKQIKTG